jgi:hypothetical protein
MVKGSPKEDDLEKEGRQQRGKISAKTVTEDQYALR